MKNTDVIVDILADIKECLSGKSETLALQDGGDLPYEYIAYQGMVECERYWDKDKLLFEEFISIKDDLKKSFKEKGFDLQDLEEMNAQESQEFKKKIGFESKNIYNSMIERLKKVADSSDSKLKIGLARIGIGAVAMFLILGSSVEGVDADDNDSMEEDIAENIKIIGAIAQVDNFYSNHQYTIPEKFLRPLAEYYIEETDLQKREQTLLDVMSKVKDNEITSKEQLEDYLDGTESDQKQKVDFAKDLDKLKAMEKMHEVNTYLKESAEKIYGDDSPESVLKVIKKDLISDDAFMQEAPLDLQKKIGTIRETLEGMVKPQ